MALLHVIHNQDFLWLIRFSKSYAFLLTIIPWFTYEHSSRTFLLDWLVFHLYLHLLHWVLSWHCLVYFSGAIWNYTIDFDIERSRCGDGSSGSRWISMCYLSMLAAFREKVIELCSFKGSLCMLSGLRLGSTSAGFNAWKGVRCRNLHANSNPFRGGYVNTLSISLVTN